MDGIGGFPTRTWSGGSSVQSGSRSPRPSKPAKTSFMKRFAKKIMPNRDPEGQESSEAESRASSQDNNADPPLALGTLLSLVTDLLARYELGAAMLLLDSLTCSALAEASLSCSRSDLSDQLARFLGKHHDAVSKNVLAVVQQYGIGRRSEAPCIKVEDYSREPRHATYKRVEFPSLSWKSESRRSRSESPQRVVIPSRSESPQRVVIPSCSSSPQRVVIPMRCSLLRWCRGTRNSSQSQTFANVYAEPDSDISPRRKGKPTTSQQLSVDARPRVHRLRTAGPAEEPYESFRSDSPTLATVQDMRKGTHEKVSSLPGDVP